MIISRGTALLRAAKLLRSSTNPCKPSVRNSGHAPWNYRTAAPPQEPQLYQAAEIVQGFMWWWVLWHLWTQFDHISGEFEYPDASKWTDEELGIPPEE